MAQNPKLVDPHLDWNRQVKSIRLDIDQDRARALGLTPQEVAQTLQTLVSVYTVTQYREDRADRRRRAPSRPERLDRLPALTIATRDGVGALSQVARLSYQFEPILWRRNRDLVLTVRSDVIDACRRPNNEVAPKLATIRDALPYGLSDRNRRVDRGKREGKRRAGCCFPVMECDADAADDPAAELLTAGAGVHNRAARAHWCNRRRCSSQIGRSALLHCWASLRSPA
jgi:hypothetical protein